MHVDKHRAQPLAAGHKTAGDAVWVGTGAGANHRAY